MAGNQHGGKQAEIGQPLSAGPECVVREQGASQAIAQCDQDEHRTQRTHDWTDRTHWARSDDLVSCSVPKWSFGKTAKRAFKRALNRYSLVGRETKDSPAQTAAA